jgi:cytochrome c-type biogenesis protein CcmH/NrfG
MPPRPLQSGLHQARVSPGLHEAGGSNWVASRARLQWKRIALSQRRQRPTARPATKGRPVSRNRNQTLYAVLGVIVVIALIGAGIGPPVIDYLTQINTERTTEVDPNNDPVEQGYREQIAANPDDPAALAALADYLGNIGRANEAIPLYDRALTLAPDNIQMRFAFANTLVRAGKSADAELQFQKVIAAEPNHIQAHFNLALTYENWIPPRTADAILEYQKVLDIGIDEFVVEVARDKLVQLGVASPVAATPEIAPTEVPQ